MATLGATAYTLYDFATQKMSDDSLTNSIIENLARVNQLFQYLPVVEANKVDSHEHVRRSALATVGYAVINQGTAPSKNRTEKTVDSIATLRGIMDVDFLLLDMNNWEPQFLRNETAGFAEAFSQQISSDIISADTDVTPEKFDGLQPRLDTVSTTRGTYGYQMLNGGGSGSDNSSIYFLALGENTCHGLYGKGKSAGLRKTWEGEHWKSDGTNDYLNYRTQWEWNFGLAVPDPQSVVRICNIDVSNLVSGTSAADMERFMYRAIDLCASRAKGRGVFIMNRTLKAYLRIQMSEFATQVWTNVKDKFLNPMMAFNDYPIIEMEAIGNAEATVSGTFQSDL